MAVMERDLVDIDDSSVRLSRDIAEAAKTLSAREARYLVDAYYTMQEHRIRSSHQARASEEAKEPHRVTMWFQDRAALLEAQVKKALAIYAQASPVGRWALSVHGIGPVLAAGFLAHIEIERAPTVGHIWRFAGLDPTVAWDRGERRPWNARLKVLCWKAGESFKKFHRNPKCVYGVIYAERKALEVARNDAGAFREQAEATLVKAPRHAQRAIYQKGKLPPGRLDLRASRYAVKLFLSHLHHVMYEVRYGTVPPKPYILTRPDHAHYVAPPGWPMES